MLTKNVIRQNYLLRHFRSMSKLSGKDLQLYAKRRKAKHTSTKLQTNFDKLKQQIEELESDINKSIVEVDRMFEGNIFLRQRVHLLEKSLNIPHPHNIGEEVIV